MGSVLTLLKNAINSVKRFNATVSRMRQNIADVRKCSKDIASIIHDLNSISFEVKTAVQECSSALQMKLCEQIYNRLTTEDLEYIHHIVFYMEFVSHIEKMQKVDRGISGGDIACYLLDETKNKIKQYKRAFRDEGRCRLLAEMETFLEINSHYELESISISEENDTLMTFLEDTKDRHDVCNKEENRANGETWISMDLLGKSKEVMNHTLRKQTKKSRKNPLLKLFQRKKKNATEGSANMHYIKTFTSLLKLQQQLSGMVFDHLSRTTYAEIQPVKAFLIKNIINKESLYEIDNNLFTPRMAKVNSKLEKIIKKHDLAEINLKVKINPEINFGEALEILDDATRKVHQARDEVIENTKSTKTLLMTDIEDFGFDMSPRNDHEVHHSEILPFGNTLSFIKEKGSKAIGTNFEDIIKRPYILESIQAGKLIRLADAVADTRELIMHPNQFVQHVFTDEKYEILLYFMRIIDENESHCEGKIPISHDCIGTLIAHLIKHKALQALLGDEQNEDISILKIMPLVDKLNRITIDEKSVVDALFDCLLNKKQSLQLKISDDATWQLINTMLNENLKKLPVAVSSFITEDAFLQKPGEKYSPVSRVKVGDDLRPFMKGLFRAMHTDQGSIGKATHMRTILIRELLLRLLN